MEKTITINGKNYTIKNIDFKAICELEELGLSLAEIKSKTFSCLRSCVAFQIGATLDQANIEIEEHFKKGGKLEDLIPCIEAVVNSDFFQHLA